MRVDINETKANNRQRVRVWWIVYRLINKIQGVEVCLSK